MDSIAEPWPFGSGSGYLHLPKANCAPNYNPPTERWQCWRRDSQKMREKRVFEREDSTQPPVVRVLPGDSSAEAVLDVLASDGAVVVRTRPQRGLLCEAAATAALPSGKQCGHSAALLAALGPEQSTGLLAEPLIMEVCDAVLASQALRMDADELARRVVGACASRFPSHSIPHTCTKLRSPRSDQAQETSHPIDRFCNYRGRWTMCKSRRSVPWNLPIQRRQYPH